MPFVQLISSHENMLHVSCCCHFLVIWDCPVGCFSVLRSFAVGKYANLNPLTTKNSWESTDLRYICHLFFASFPIFSSLNGSHILVFFSNLLTCRNPCCKTFLHVFAVLLPSGKQTVCYWKWPSRNIGFTHEKLWFSIVMLVYQRVCVSEFHVKMPNEKNMWT